MTTRRRKDFGEKHPNSNTPAQEDEADILDEVGGERDEGGELLVDEEAVREIGAVDAASVRENRRMEAVVKKKRGGEKHVVFNTDDLLTKYEGLIKEWPPNTLDITVTRLTGTPVKYTIVSRPRSGVELYAAIMAVHGQYEETQYEVKFLDSNQKQYRGTGRITMPDTRPAGQQGQPMHYPPNGAPPGYVPVAAAPWPQPQQALPVTQAAPQALDPIAMMRQMFEMFQTMRPQPPQTQIAPPVPPPAFSPQVVPTDPMAMMKAMFEMFQQTQGAQPVAMPVAAPPAPVQPVVVAPAPPQVDPIEHMTRMFELFQKMQGPRPMPGPRAPYYPQGEGRPAYQGPNGGSPPPPPQRPPTISEQWREMTGVMRSARDMKNEMEELFPNSEPQENNASPEDDDSPVRVIDTGPAKIVVNKSDGSTRLWETGMANMDKIFKWVGEQRAEIQKEAADRQQRQQVQTQQRQLPLGFVEVGPGFVPPAGFVAVPVEHSDLPPPPANVPPPIESPPPSRQAWGEPTIPEEHEQ